MERTKRTERGLTIVEMAVVLGICGMLAMLLLPMALKARSNARAIVCTDNLKGLGQAFAVSMVQSNGYLPDTYYSYQGNSGTYQIAFKADGVVDSVFKEGSKDILTCPSDASPVKVTVTAMNGSATTVPASYAYNVSLPTMFRNASRVRQPLNTVSFYDGDVSGVIGEWNHTMGWAKNTIRARHGNKANYLFLDGHVESSADFPDMAFEGGGNWTASALDTRQQFAPAQVPGGSSSNTQPKSETPAGTPVVFTIENGAVIPGEDVTCTITCLGAAFQYGEGGPEIPVSAFYALGDNKGVNISSDVKGGESAVTTLDAGTTLATEGKTSKYYSSDYSSDDGSGHTWVLRDGDTVPSVAGFGGQRGIEDFIKDYITPGGKVDIGQNDVIFLFELSGQTDYTHYSHADFQDLVILVHFEAKSRGVSGSININPNNSDYEFALTLPDGKQVTRDNLASDTIVNHSGFATDKLEYTGPAVTVLVKPKGNGNQNSLIVDGSPYPLQNKNRYVISSDNMTVHLYNDKRNKQGKAMGKWWIAITANQAKITYAK